MPKMTKKLKRILKSYGIKYRVVQNVFSGGYASSLTNTIYLSYTNLLTRRDLISAIFHEMCHILCYKEKKYYNYHYYIEKPMKNKINTLIRTGLKAEKYVDKMAKKIMKKHYPTLKYIKGYDKEGVLWYKENIIPQLKAMF